jgi:hypothetical protein
MLPKKPKKYSFNYCSCCQRQKQLRLKISTSTYLLRASSAALSFGLKNKTELKNVTDRLNRWCASGPGLDIIQLLLLKHLHDYTFLGPKILKIKPKKPNISNSNSRIRWSNNHNTGHLKLQLPHLLFVWTNTHA